MPSVKKLSTALSLEDLDKQYNPAVIIPSRIREALARLGDGAMKSADFAREAGVTPLQLAQFSDLFKDFTLTVREDGKSKTIWCGTVAFADKAKVRLGI